MIRLLPFGLALLIVLAPLTAFAQTGKGDRLTGPNFATRSVVTATNAMAATSHPLPVQVGLDIMKQGGNAIDAAIAMNAMLGVVEPNNGGIGGDLFAIIWDADTRQLYGLNASGRAAQGLSYDQLRGILGDRPIPVHGPLAVSVPGAVDGWFEMHTRFGSKPMEALLAPAIRYARDGVAMTQVVAYSWDVAHQRLLDNRADIPELDNVTETFFTKNGKAPDEGDIFRNPDLANTYEMIAEGGRNAFYNGPIAEAIDQYARRAGLYLRKEDLAAHHSTWVEPVSVNYRGYDVYELPPNGQGIAALQMLNLLEAYDLASMEHNSAEFLHLMVEAKKIAFADRARLYADPEFNEIPLDRLLSDEYATERRRLIDLSKAQARDEIGVATLQQGDTFYLTVADEEGNMVSLINSNFLEFGSGLVPEGLGFALQNRGSQFSMVPGHVNVYAPGKRPFHTIIPAFVMKDGEPFMSFGVMGGPFQPQGHVQILVNMIDFGMNLQEAGDAARFAHVGSSQPTGSIMTDGGRLALESGISQEVRDELARLGHTLIPTEFFGGYQAVMRDPENGVYHGASDMRKDGHAAGY